MFWSLGSGVRGPEPCWVRDWWPFAGIHFGQNGDCEDELATHRTQRVLGRRQRQGPGAQELPQALPEWSEAPGSDPQAPPGPPSWRPGLRVLQPAPVALSITTGPVPTPPLFSPRPPHGAEGVGRVQGPAGTGWQGSSWGLPGSNREELEGGGSQAGCQVGDGMPGSPGCVSVTREPALDLHQ